MELFRSPSFLFAFGISFFGLPATGIMFNFGEFLLQIYEASVFVGILKSTGMFLLASWFVVRLDVFLREHSDDIIVGKWTIISGLSAFILLYLIYFSGSYWTAIPVQLASQSPYSAPIYRVFEISYPLLLIGATWHPSRMIYYIFDEIVPLRTNIAAKYFPYSLLVVFIIAVLTNGVNQGAELSTIIDVFILVLPAIVSISSSIREYERYGLEYHPPIGMNKIDSFIYKILHQPKFIFPIAGLCWGLYTSLFSARVGVYQTMDPTRFIIGILFGPICCRLGAEYIPTSIVQNFPHNIFKDSKN